MNEALTRTDILRLEALNHSVSSRDPESTTETILDRARKFEEFLLRDDNKDKQSIDRDSEPVMYQKYVGIIVNEKREVICARLVDPVIPEGFLLAGEYGFVVEALDWKSWYDNN